MPISFTCPHCGQTTNAAEQYAGQSGPCAQCGTAVTVPALVGAAHNRAAPRSSVFLWVVLPLLACGLLCSGLVLFPSSRGGARVALLRIQCSNHLKQIALAMHMYLDEYKTFPPAYTVDKDGRPMHSWRALLLPYLGQKDLANRYHFDEPWDSPANRQVAATCPEMYRCPSDADKAASDETNYVLIAGPGMFGEGVSPRDFAQVTDGMSNTIMIVEVTGSGIGWAEPRDLEADKISFKVNDPHSLSISSRHSGGANCAICDGSVQFLSDQTPPETVKALCTVAGGESVDPTKLNP